MGNSSFYTDDPQLTTGVHIAPAPQSINGSPITPKSQAASSFYASGPQAQATVLVLSGAPTYYIYGF